MSPRRRRKPIPVPNLYERKGYYTWRHPVTREEFGLGRDKATAMIEAAEANVHIAGMRDQTRLVDRLSGDSTRTVAAWNVKYQETLGKQGYAYGTLRTYRAWGKRMVEMLGTDKPIQAVTSLDVSTMLEKIRAEGKDRTAEAVEGYMRECFEEAKAKGWYLAENPVRKSKFRQKTDVKRARFTWETFQQVYAKIAPGWLRNAVDLALVSGQRREDIARATFRDFHDGGWWLVQRSKKTEEPHRIFIPLELRLECFGKSLADVLSQCRRSGVVSRHLVHHVTPHSQTRPGNPVHMNTITKQFAAAVKGSGVSWEPKQPPTFHELRSLAERLYKAQGGVPVQHLLGHTHATTTELYDDPRGAEVRWTKIDVGRPV